MAISMWLTELLESEGTPYEVLVHPRCYTAQETAESEHVSGKQMAKVVMLKADGKDVMMIVPANCHLDLLKASQVLNTSDVRIEEEREFESIFPDCETGGMPPFGVLYQIPCYIDQRFRDEPNIVFNAGGHTECIKMEMEKFLNLSHARVADLARRS